MNQADRMDQVMGILKNSGCRLTRQRYTIVETILRNDFETRKDIYYQVRKADPSIGMATVYRTIRQLEDYGVLRRIERIELDEAFRQA